MSKKVLVIIFVAGILILTSAVAQAADPVYDWIGPYIGTNGGWAGGSSDASTNAHALDIYPPFQTAIKQAGDHNLDSDIFIGGAQVGYNWQTGGLVLGGEMDFNYFHLSNSDSRSVTGPSSTILNGKSSLGTDWLFTLRPRVGYAFSNMLFYGTGGLAVTRINAHFRSAETSVNVYSESDSSSKTKAGWTAGCGIEMGITRNVSLKVEYLYADFGSISSSDTISVDQTLLSFSHRINLHANIVRAGLNYRF